MSEPSQADDGHMPDHSDLKLRLRSKAVELGFELCGVAPAVAPTTLANFHDWLQQGFAGEMQYIGRRREAYASPESLLTKVRSVVMLAMNYRTEDPQPTPAGQGRIARYAWGTADYHDLIRQRLQLLADWLHEQSPGCRTRGAVDTAPLLERDFARLSGLGWFGKNTMLINKRRGSWLFLAALLTDLELPPDEPHDTSHCGTCTRCLDACPTDAFPEPYVLDATRCISYLTIELRGEIPSDLQPGIGNWLFGCDICNEVCPWNHKAPRSSEPAFQPQPGLQPADPREFLTMTNTEFDERFQATPLARPGWEGMRRNAEIVQRNARERDDAVSRIDAE